MDRMITKVLMILAMLGASCAAWALPPRVVVTIQPLHSLVAGVMLGTREPLLLLDPGMSAHLYSPRPSEIAALEQADLLFWIGPGMELFLERAVNQLKRPEQIATMMEAPGLNLITTRPPEAGAPGEHDHEHGAFDPHIWLDPHNAKALVTAIMTRLVEFDPAGTTLYQRNAERLNRRLDELDQHLKARLSRFATAPYLVFHNAYGYLEQRYGLKPVGVIMGAPDQLPGAAGVGRLRELVRSRAVRCIFSEPQFDSPLIATVAEGSPARIGILDPEGALSAPGPEGYFQLMERLAQALEGCLGSGG